MDRQKLQYGGLRNSVTCVITYCNNDSFASPTHRTNRASRSYCSVSGGEHVIYRGHPINVQLVTDPVIMPAKEEHDVILVQKVLTIVSHVIS